MTMVEEVGVHGQLLRCVRHQGQEYGETEHRAYWFIDCGLFHICPSQRRKIDGGRKMYEAKLEKGW